MVKRNQFINDDNLSELLSLTHLLERNDNDDNEETPILKHSPFYTENQFIDIITRDTGLSILDLNNNYSQFIAPLFIEFLPADQIDMPHIYTNYCHF